MERIIILFICIQFSYCAGYQSLVVLQGNDKDFEPANPIELIKSRNDLYSTFQCYSQCHMSFQCRTFVYKSKIQECSLYEGSVDTGSVTATGSNETVSVVGGLVYTSEFFISYGQTCDQCISTRYLACVDNMCQCLPNTFWNGTMCLNQVYYGGTCAVNPSSCRNTDLSLTCLSDCHVCVGKCFILATLKHSAVLGSSTACTILSNSSGPIASWSFDGNLSDSSATAVGNVAVVNGHQGQAIQLSGTSYVSFSAFFNISYRSFTMEMWIYPTSMVSYMGLFTQIASAGGDTQFSLFILDSTLYVTYGWDDTEDFTALQVNQWYHIALVYNS